MHFTNVYLCLMMDDFGLKKWERITCLKTIDHLFTGGQKHFEYPFRVFYGFNQDSSPLKGHLEMAIAVPKKRVRRAHHRNYIKRITREAFRLNNVSLKKSLIEKNQRLSIFLVFAGAADVNFDQVQHKIILLLNRFQNEFTDLQVIEAL